MFSVSTEKRPVYLLPAFPAACLLTVGIWPQEGWLPSDYRRRWRLLAPFQVLVLLAVGLLVIAPLAQGRIGGGGWSLTVAGGCALAVALGSLRAARAGQARVALGLAAGSTAAVLLGLALGLAPALNPSKSARPLSERVLSHLGPSGRLGMYRFYRSAYVFYTRRFLEKIDGPPELERFLAEPSSYCLIDRDDYHRLPPALRQRYIPLEEADVGHRRMLLIGGDALQPGRRNQSRPTMAPNPITIKYSRLRTMRPQDQERRSACT
jgi:hypothetical protein